MAQIAGEVLDIPAENVRIVHPDTDVTPYDMGTLGSRSTFHMGQAVKCAAEEARDKLLGLAKELGVSPETTPIRDLFRQRYGMQAGNVVGTGIFNPKSNQPDHSTGLAENITPNWMIGGTGAEVEVDTETGHVRVTKLVSVADCGTPLNPKIVESQLSGAATMQLGCTMSEGIRFDAGQATNASLADYKIPGIRDVPPVFVNDIVDARQESGPFGAKGVGETGTFGVSAAIANAIHDAVGVRITRLPITPEAVYKAIRAAANQPLEEE
jgi:CO/xanthine dehydrogenase Mo-binding subunit